MGSPVVDPPVSSAAPVESAPVESAVVEPPVAAPSSSDASELVPSVCPVDDGVVVEGPPAESDPEAEFPEELASESTGATGPWEPHPMSSIDDNTTRDR
jgi:hypothetical protein